MAEEARRECVNRRHTLIEEIIGMAKKIVRVFGLAMEGISRLRVESLRQALAGGQAVDREAGDLTASLVALAEGRPCDERAAMQSDIRAVGQLKLISGCIEDLCEAAMARIKEGLLFSDEAFKEIEGLHGELDSLLNSVALAMGGPDGNLSSAAVEKGRAIEVMIEKSSIEHEKRLMSGVCDARSSAIFLDILDALRRIAGHAVALARDGVCRSESL